MDIYKWVATAKDVQKDLMDFVESLGYQPADIVKLRSRLSSETDLGCALIAGAYLDGLLKKALQNSFVEDKTVIQELVEGNGPISSFSCRINIAFAIGIISSNVRHDLNLIRKIRNDFAHAHHELMFEDHKIKNRCDSLIYKTNPFARTARDNFLTSMMSIIGEIEGAIGTTKRFPERPNIGPEKYVEWSNVYFKTISMLTCGCQQCKAMLDNTEAEDKVARGDGDFPHHQVKPE